MKNIFKKLSAFTLVFALIAPSIMVQADELQHVHTNDCYITHNHEVNGCEYHEHTGSPIGGGGGAVIQHQ